MSRRSGALAALLPLALAGGMQAQGFEGRVGQFYEGTGWTLYRLGVTRPLGGPFGLAYHGTYLTREGDREGAFAGVGADVTAFRGAGNGPYLVTGVGGGLGSPRSRDFSSLWGSWSAGAGYQLFPLSVLAFAAEARWREMSLDARDGVELSAGFSIRLGGGRSPPPRPAAPLPATAARSPRVLGDSVVATAAEAMGRPYRYGGTGADGGGFDCSGLIQYAYAQHGITLPRTSREQAREGRKVPRTVGELAPGDLLTFSNRGGPVTHVGLYLGDGRFIHSATRGVQVSLLSGEDPYGRWWYTRWVGARRIVDQDGDRLDD